MNQDEPQPLTMNDVILMHNIIATASRRGAFEASEFQVVGGLFEKLKAIMPTADEATENNPAETTNTSTTVDAGQTEFKFASETEDTAAQ
jgi:hypothetical protein